MSVLAFSIGLVKWSALEATIFFVVPIGRFLACSNLFSVSCYELEVDGNGNGKRMLMMFGCRDHTPIAQTNVRLWVVGMWVIGFEVVSQYWKRPSSLLWASRRFLACS